MGKHLGGRKKRGEKNTHVSQSVFMASRTAVILTG